MHLENSREALALNAGLDEVGMGCLAGPVTVVVAVFPTDMERIPGVGDSKKLTKKKRQDLVPIILEQVQFVGVGWSHPKLIDEVGLAEAWNRACLQALDGMPEVEELVVDGVRVINDYDGPQVHVVKADDTVWQVGAASILAKTIRDVHMVDMAECYKGYGWETNAGYGSKTHLKALKKLGPSSYHRRTFLKKIC